MPACRVETSRSCTRGRVCRLSVCLSVCRMTGCDTPQGVIGTGVGQAGRTGPGFRHDPPAALTGPPPTDHKPNGCLHKARRRPIPAPKSASIMATTLGDGLGAASGGATDRRSRIAFVKATRHRARCSRRAGCRAPRICHAIRMCAVEQPITFFFELPF